MPQSEHYPQLVIQIKNNNLRLVEKKGEVSKVLYNQTLFTAGIKVRVLEGFSDFSLKMTDENDLFLHMDKCEYHVQIESDQKVRLKDPLNIKGGFICLAPEIQQQGKLQANTIILNSAKIEFLAQVVGESDIELRAQQLVIADVLFCKGDIKVWTDGFKVVSTENTVFAEGNLHFHWSNQVKIEQVFCNPLGGLKHSVCSENPQSIQFLGDQKAKGTIHIESEVDVELGAPDHYATLISDEANIMISTPKDLLICGRLLAADTLHCEAGQRITIGSKDQPRPALVASVRCLQFKSENLVWDHAQLRSQGDLCVKAKHLEDIASDTLILGNVVLDADDSRHQLLIKKEKNHYTVPVGWDGAHAAHREIGERESQASVPSLFIVHGHLTHHGRMEIIGSQMFYKSYSGDLPMKRTFVPFEDSIVRGYFGGKRNFWWAPPQGCSLERIYGKPVPAIFSVGSSLTVNATSFSFSGILSAIGVKLTGIERGHIGHTQSTVQLAVSQGDTKTHWALMDYASPSALYEIVAERGDTVFQSIMPQFNSMHKMDMVMVADPKGFVRANIHNRRRLFTAAQEKELLVKALLANLQRGFLNEELTDPEQMIRQLHHNTLKLLHTENTQAVAKQNPWEDAPMLVYVETNFVHASQKEETVLAPVVYIPKAFQVLTPSDGAGGIYSFEDIVLEGNSKLSSQLMITGHLYAKGCITFKRFERLTQSRRVVQLTKTVTDEIKSKKTFKNKCYTVQKQIVVKHLQPGNTLQALGVDYQSIQYLALQGLIAAVGEEGIKTLDVKHIDEAMVLGQTPFREPHKRGVYNGVMQQIFPTSITALGPVHLDSKTGNYDTLSLTSSGQFITGGVLSFGEGPKRLQAERKREDSVAREAKRTAKRKRRQAIVKSVATIGATAYFSTLIASRLLQLSGLKAAITEGAVFGSINALGHRQDPIRGALEGALFGVFGHEMAKALSGSIVAAKQDFLREIIQEATKSSVLAVGQTLLYGGDFVENVLVSAAAHGLGQAIAPKPQLNAMKTVSYAARVGLHSAAVGGVSLLLKRSEDFSLHMVSATLGSMVQRLGELYGQKELLQAAQHAVRKNPIVQGSPMEVQEKFAALGIEVEPKASAEKAILLGAQQAFVNVLQSFVEEVHALDAAETAKQDSFLRIMKRGTAGAVGSLSTVAELSWDMLAGTVSFITNAHTIGEGLTEPHLQDVAFREAYSQNRQVLDAMGYLATHLKESGQALVASVDQRLRLAQAEYQRGNDWDAGLINGGVGAEVGLLATGGVSLMKTAARAPVLMFTKTKPQAFSELKVVIDTLPIAKPALNQVRLPALKSYDFEVHKALKVRLKTRGFPEVQLKRPGLLLPEPLLVHERFLVEEWQSARNTYLKKWRNVEIGVTVDHKKVDAIIRKHMTPDDIAALFKEGRGVKIRSDFDGRFVDHRRKSDMAQQTLTKAVLQIKRSFSAELGKYEIKLLQDKLSDLSRLKDLHAKLIGRAQCPKLIPKP